MINICSCLIFAVGGSIANKGDEDISPYATFHLLGMREEANKAAAAAANFQTLPPGATAAQNPNGTPAKHLSQTMNVS